MKEEHPAREDLEQFMRGELTPAAGREVVRHLLGGCALCMAVTRSFWPLGARGSRPASVATSRDLETRARVRFAQGMLEAQQGRVAEADRALLAAEREFLLLGSGRGAGQALVQRALLRLRQPERLPLRDLGADVLPILRCGDLTRGDAAALLLVRSQVETEQASVGLLSEISVFLAGRPQAQGPATEHAPGSGRSASAR